MKLEDQREFSLVALGSRPTRQRQHNRAATRSETRRDQRAMICRSFKRQQQIEQCLPPRSVRSRQAATLVYRKRVGPMGRKLDRRGRSREPGAGRPWAGDLASCERKFETENGDPKAQKSYNDNLTSKGGKRTVPLNIAIVGATRSQSCQW